MISISSGRNSTIFLLSIVLAASFFGCGGGGGGGGAVAFSGAGGDPSFFVEELFYGRPLLDPAGNVFQVINPASVIETDPITGIMLEGFPQLLFPQEPIGKLGTFSLGEQASGTYNPKIIPRNAAIMVDFSQSVNPDSMNLGPNYEITGQSPIQIFTEGGDPIPTQALVWKDKVILNPVTEGKVGFPPSPLIFDQEGNPVAPTDGFLKVIINSAGTNVNVVLSVSDKELSAREDLMGSPVNPVPFNPGNGKLDFINYGDISFNGFLPDLSPPRIIREVQYEGTAGAGSDQFTIVDPSASFVVEANNNHGEWAGGLLTLREGTVFEEKVKVETNSEDTLYVSGGFVVPPEPGDDYLLQRAEFFEPIPGLTDLSTAVDPDVHPKDPFDPEDLKNSNLVHFVRYDAWDEGDKIWKPQNYDPGPGLNNPIDPKWRITLRFSEPMDVDSFRSYESFYVCNAANSVEDPAFNDMKLGRVTESEGGKVISYEPVLEDQLGGVGDQLVGFGGKPKTLRLVLRMIPPKKKIEDFYQSLGNPKDWPPGVVADLEGSGVLGVFNLGGQALGIPSQFLDKGSPHCVAYQSSSGHGAFPPAVDMKLEFSTLTTTDPEYGALVHRFMGLPETGVGGTPPISGIIFNDHPDGIYGPHIADTSIGLNGFLSGHPVEFIEHVFDDYNHPPPSSQTLPENTYPDPIFKIPFGVATPVTASDGVRFQHVYRRGDCSPDVPALEDTILDLIGLSWSPIGGWVTNTMIEKLAIAVGDSTVIPNTHQSAGIPTNANSGLMSNMNSNYKTPGSGGIQRLVYGNELPLGGLPYFIDWKNLYAPKNAGKNFNNYLPWPQFDKPVIQPGFPFKSKNSMLIEYRMDPNENTGLATNNGFTFHAGIISSMLPRFRVYSRGDKNTFGQVYGASNPNGYNIAWGPVGGTGVYGDNSRYFMIFDYVKRESLIESPYLTTEIGLSERLDLMIPVVLPPLTDIPFGTSLDITYKVSPNPSNPNLGSDYVDASDIETFNVGTTAKWDHVRFKAVFKANVSAGVVPTIDTIIVPYMLVPENP